MSLENQAQCIRDLADPYGIPWEIPTTLNKQAMRYSKTFCTESSLQLLEHDHEEGERIDNEITLQTLEENVFVSLSEVVDFTLTPTEAVYLAQLLLEFATPLLVKEA